MLPKSVITANATTQHCLGHQIFTLHGRLQSQLWPQYVRMKFWMCTLHKTKHRVYLVFVLCDYIHIAAGQLEVQKKLENDSQNQYHSSQPGCL